MADVTSLPGVELAGAECEVERVAANDWRVRARGVRIRARVDECGSWLTVGRADGLRAVVVRRAGWVDGRNAPCRVGLGPGDSMVLAAGDDVVERLLPCTAAEAADLAAATGGSLVLRVAPFADGLARAVAATGLPPEAFDEPLHPVGSPDAELWSRRPDPPVEARMRLEPVADAVPAARALLRRLLASWRMSELLEGDVELLATELLTNAVLHAATAMTVVIGYDGTAVRFEVHDSSPVLPRPEDPPLDSERGRGLWLISRLADAWDVEPTADGKRIWFEVTA